MDPVGGAAREVSGIEGTSWLPRLRRPVQIDKIVSCTVWGDVAGLLRMTQSDRRNKVQEIAVRRIVAH